MLTDHCSDHKIIPRNIFPLNCENTPCWEHFQPTKCSYWPLLKTYLRSNMSIVPTRITTPKSNFPSKMFLLGKLCLAALQQLQRQQTPLPQHYTADRNRHMNTHTM